ncbi:extracellular solute-binding protein [Zoogloea sp.]|uniref:extracellular solute-binding protein n=1 Tax=Zoogloea sp. TaxID=49181 RepID=UPI0026102EAC|nr:extracellular solute-binding protein [Zoogloea sp.]MDD3355206.1 extracellular solute-binding protein [Zoogloea sp.]
MIKLKTLAVLLAGAAALTSQAQAADTELNLYTARHYQTDENLYTDFTAKTGIKINRIEGKEEELLERIRNEGANSPADIFITVDAARLAAADQYGLFATVDSPTLKAAIPAHLRTDRWFAYSTRARVIVYNKLDVKAEQVRNYEDLAKPALKGKVCTRSGSHAYNLSLGAALIQHLGAARTEEWAKGLVANFARAPKGGDTDQIKAVGAGECGVALVNSYYLARMLKSSKPEDRKAMERIGIIWPNQGSFGTHINISGGGMLKTAPHKQAAVKFLEYLASMEAQDYFANGNNEWPVVAGVKLSNRGLEAMGGSFKADTLPVGKLAESVVEAQRIYDRAGFR